MGAADARRATCHDAVGVWTKSLFTVRDLVLTTDTGTEAATKRAEFIWKSLGSNNAGAAADLLD